MTLFQQLDAFPISCVYALVDESIKGMYVYFSENNSIAQLGKAIVELKRGLHDSKVIQESYRSGRLEIKVLKDYNGKPPIEAIVRAEAAHLLRNSGYTDLRGVHLPAYRIKTRIKNHYKKTTCAPPLVYVTAQSRTRGVIVMAVFDCMIDADAWIDEVYPGQREVSGIVPSFALNERTREYHELHGYFLFKKSVSS